MHFEISKPDKSIVVFKLHEKKLDALISPELKAEFLALCSPEIKTVIVDLSEVQHCDSSGLSSLLFCERRVRENSGEVLLVGVTEKVLNLMKIARIDSLFKFFNSVEEAIKTKR